MKSVQFFLFLFLALSLERIVSSEETPSEEPFVSEVIVLDVDTFEHETQAATGATTGDWFVKFYAPWCGHCKRLEPIWNELATNLKGTSVNVAKVDVTSNRLLGQRFEIKGFPTLLFFHHGFVYRYKGARDIGNLTAYAKGDYKKNDDQKIPVPPVPTIFTELKKALLQIKNALMFYAQNPSQIKENEWGFFAAGMLIGSLVSSVIYIVTNTVSGKRQKRQKKD